MGDGRDSQFGQAEAEAYAWVKKFASGTASEADLRALERWSAKSPEHREAFARISRTWQGLGPVGEKFPRRDFFFQPRAAAPSLAADRAARLRRRAIFGGAVGVAAAAALAAIADPPLGLWPSWAELHADYRTATGQQRQVTLPSGVSIAMNTRTYIALQPKQDGVSRIELIAGEAMIASGADSNRFIVTAAAGRIFAAAANFNVWRYDTSVCVTCLNGAVSVQHGQAAIPLNAGQQIFYSDNEISKAKNVDPEIVTSWLNGIVIFRAAPVAEVIEAVNRYRPGKIILTNEALGRRRINARLRIQDIGEVVSQIQAVFGAHVTNLPGGIVLLG